MQFKNKVAVVTGAGGGIGEGYAMRLASEGAAVAIADIDEEGGERVAKAINAAGGNAIFYHCDVSSPSDATALAQAVEAHLGGADFLVNNASIFGKIEYIPLMDVDLDYYLKVQSVNMNGALIMTRAIAPLIERRGGGAIVNQTSTAAWVKNGGYYGVFKLAMNGLTTNLAMELGPRNIRVNAIAPGPVGTPAMLATVDPDMIEGIIQGGAVKRIGRVEDMADACVFLLSDQSSWISGQILAVDGGFIMRA
ncbi:SDR family oxidoreductase [Sphingobium phenoxybenzoativorans]|uniref:SDR family oxidoreductase n=1 Tax=Sphingobium phenoxybenzoativorans TaxID=1592790 RepID=A0A975K8F8_9SPHN|nr:SDR family oxidoreductase [Sphingobium phenoxybenzoativorans]QUT06726.1 SDR family oxidoreductase [Sphingobium phenoxybenzoativorans]